MAQTFPLNPLAELPRDDGYQRRQVSGVLESYNGNYDLLAEMVQNAVDAVEDSVVMGQDGPHEVHVYLDLNEQRIAVRDTGVGMNSDQVGRAFAPSVSFKSDSAVVEKRGGNRRYRGYKGVGLTFLAYGTDYVRLHSSDGVDTTRVRMQAGRSWANEEVEETPLVVADDETSKLNDGTRGTYVEVRLSRKTRPKHLGYLATGQLAWEAILRTRTALGQIFLDGATPVQFQAFLHVIDKNGEQLPRHKVEPTFLYPHSIKGTPAFRWLDVGKYHADNPETPGIPKQLQRQDGLFFKWSPEDIKRQLSAEETEAHDPVIAEYQPWLYGFITYNASIWNRINEHVAKRKRRKHLDPGLLLAINRQRLADVFDLAPTRFENWGRNLFVLVHFDNAKPDQGRKTVQDEIQALARDIGNRALQYLAKQRDFLKPPGDALTPEQRQVEMDHEEWLLNVRGHARANQISLPPLAYVSPPLVEQDVVGMFNQLMALGVFPGLQVYATSQVHTYDSLVFFQCSRETPGLTYVSDTKNALGVSRFVLGDAENFRTKTKTLEFKNNLDALVAEVDSAKSPKEFSQVDLCVCWSHVADEFKGFVLEKITPAAVENSRHYPGVTHLLRRDGDRSVVSVIMLKEVIRLLEAGAVPYPAMR